MLLTSRFFKSFLLIIFALGLSQCVQTMDVPAEVVHVSQPLVSPHSKSATIYLALAKNQTGSEKQASLMMAAGRLIYDGRWREGLAILSQLNDLPAEFMSEKRLLLAKIDLIRGQPRVALAKLATVQDVNQLSIYNQVQFHEMLAHAYQSVGNATESVSERIKLEQLLPDDVSKANNRRALWLTLTRLPIAELNSIAVEAKDGTELEAWMQLALISRKNYSNPQVMLKQVEQWQEKYPGHPGHYIFPSPLTDVSARLFVRPRQLALLLPLTGPLAGPGGAIKDGFMAGLQTSSAPSSMNVHTYNTDSVNIEALYKQAVADGADFVVGPLSKVNAATVAAMPHPVPTVLLNDVDTRSNDSVYQFGLSPSNEARQVAAKARKSGYSRALIIAPADDWGREVVTAFSNQWRTNGGYVVDTFSYRPNDDLGADMRDFLQVSASEMRGKKVKELLGQHVEVTPSRRQDFDVIFLLAYPSTARQIMPLLNYYYAGDVPVYATSAAYAGVANATKDRDLNGLIFCDMPWVFEHQKANRNWPEQFNSYNRLYALGMDSYSLSTQLNQLLLFPAMGISDKSGVLYLTSSQQIVRMLAWGQFKQGLAQELTEN